MYRAVLFAMVIGLLFLQYHLYGNGHDPATYSRSAFRWLGFMWDYMTHFGGIVYHAGWIFPVAALSVVWRRRRALRDAAGGPALSAAGLILLLEFFHWAGIKSQQTRLSLIALVLIPPAICWMLYGRKVARLLILPTLIALFIVPLNFLDSLFFPVQEMIAGAGRLLMAGFGIETTGAGSYFTFPAAGRAQLQASGDLLSIYPYLTMAAFVLWMAGMRDLSRRRTVFLLAESTAVLFMLSVIWVFMMGLWVSITGRPESAPRGIPFQLLVYGITMAAVWFSQRLDPAAIKQHARQWIAQHQQP